MSGASAAQRAIRAELGDRDEPISLQELHGDGSGRAQVRNRHKVPAK
jgi:hypothetical protein